MTARSTFFSRAGGPRHRCSPILARVRSVRPTSGGRRFLPQPQAPSPSTSTRTDGWTLPLLTGASPGSASGETLPAPDSSASISPRLNGAGDGASQRRMWTTMAGSISQPLGKVPEGAPSRCCAISAAVVSPT